ncbi:hypothetical protein MSG28_009285 [Choristoneura fumiferana]|uniref:Uncharacterized protein n=1 Tax=Choristoneura fumiferana TaxID=7141 RepID=A0ACC0KXJ7_CHOFU|nr:hypothetical protein MSG28_009285 [Choristoneura fumiferana]
MVKKKIDNRIRVMIENGVKLGHRTMFLLVGDKSRDQVIGIILSGEKIPGLLMVIIRFVLPLHDHTIKKLLLIFWEIVPKTTADGKLMQEMILVCDAYRKVGIYNQAVAGSDLQHPNEFIRGSTLRFLCKLKEPELLEPLLPAIRAYEAAAIPIAHVSAAATKAPLALLSSTIKLEEPIRYRSGDPIEAWLNSLLCLESPAPSVGVGAPSPHSCDLYRVNRDALFCYHKAAEAFLHRLVAIYVASHYKNSPNDLQLLADAPAHCLFVLLAPTPPNATSMPEVLCVVGPRQPGSRPEGGRRSYPLEHLRAVRRQRLPQTMGYGKRALQQLAAYYSGEIPCLEDRQAKPPTLLKRLPEVQAEHMDYLGTSFGLTEDLLKFWKSQKYVPVYVRYVRGD